MEKTKKLTTFQRKLVINVISGMSQREAYVKAGGKAKTQNAQDNSASVTMSKPEVKAFYESMLEKAQTKAVMTKEKALLRLKICLPVTMSLKRGMRNMASNPRA